MTTEQRLEFGPAMSGLFIDTLGKALTPELRASLKTEGVDLDKPLLPAYPARVFERAVRVVARGLYADRSEDEGLRLLGRRAVEGLNTNFLGRAVLLAAKALGLRRVILRIDRTFRNSNNYMRVDARELSPTSAEFIFNTVNGMPTYFAGVLSAVVEVFGARDGQVTHEPLDGERHRFVLSWTE
ncbi:MAG: hypothetical protein DI536_06155 [Archangium gephyra]|uniref:DUF2378 family protein n=1 Tax=Archangium gephyra TaxID=48 RepID=A0A2W5VLJ8_9BACT|nr:MAG: hypothetical protein DI536_06155 [Archangium gephyra]